MEPPSRPAYPVEPVRVVRVYTRHERPDVLVLVGGDWLGGRLRKWSRDATGHLWASVTWGRGAEKHFIGVFHAVEVRDEVEGQPPGP